MNESIKPQARHDQLIVQELPDELLVYDLAAHRAYCLNRPAAIVWNLCGGDKTTADLAARLGAELNVAPDEEVIRLALEELEKCRLLQTPVNETAAGSGERINRRELTRRLGFAAAASLPVIAALSSPTAAQSGSKLSNGAACTLSSQCASGCCDPTAGVCASADVCDTGI